MKRYNKIMFLMLVLNVCHVHGAITIKVSDPGLIEQWQDIHQAVVAHVQNQLGTSYSYNTAPKHIHQKASDFIRDSFLDIDLSQPDDLVRVQAISFGSIEEAIRKNAGATLMNTLKKAFPSYPYKGKTASVRTGTALSSQEKAFINKRTPGIKRALKNHFNIKVGNKRVPRIAICSSGGGGRAMLATLGFLQGAEDIGLLDCSMYQVGLSGSTWVMAPWSLMHGQKGKSLAGMKSMYETVLPKRGKKLNGEVYSPPIPVGVAVKELSNHLLRSIAYNQPISAVSTWGSLIGNTVLTDATNKFSVNWAEVARNIEKGGIPLPLCAAISQKVDGEHQWYEFSPFEIGSRQARAFIPTWALGRKFGNKKSTNVVPPMPLSYSLGIFGSAFEIEIKELIDHIDIKNPGLKVPGIKKKIEVPLKEMVIKVIKSVSKGGYIAPTDLPNFVPGGPKKLHLLDAGNHSNIPLPLALRPERHVDMVVVLDCSGNIHNARELGKAAAWCREHGYKVPKSIKGVTRGVTKKDFTVFNHPYEKGYQPHVPVIFYVPLYKRAAYGSFDPYAKCTQSYCSNAPNFHYTKDGVDKLSGLTRFIMKQNTVKFALKDILYELVNKKPMSKPVKPKKKTRS